MKEEKIMLYSVVPHVECLRCGNKGAIQAYGKYTPNEKHMSHIGGFGGTVPYECLNCGNVGLIDIKGLEGYQQAFRTLEKKENSASGEKETIGTILDFFKAMLSGYIAQDESGWFYRLNNHILEESQDLKVWRKTEEFEYGTINGRWKIIKLLDKRN